MWLKGEIHEFSPLASCDIHRELTSPTDVMLQSARIHCATVSSVLMVQARQITANTFCFLQLFTVQYTSYSHSVFFQSIFSSHIYWFCTIFPFSTASQYFHSFKVSLSSKEEPQTRLKKISAVNNLFVMW